MLTTRRGTQLASNAKHPSTSETTVTGERSRKRSPERGLSQKQLNTTLAPRPGRTRHGLLALLLAPSHKLEASRSGRHPQPDSSTNDLGFGGDPGDAPVPRRGCRGRVPPTSFGLRTTLAARPPAAHAGARRSAIPRDRAPDVPRPQNHSRNSTQTAHAEGRLLDRVPLAEGRMTAIPRSERSPRAEPRKGPQPKNHAKHASAPRPGRTRHGLLAPLLAPSHKRRQPARSGRHLQPDSSANDLGLQGARGTPSRIAGSRPVRPPAGVSGATRGVRSQHDRASTSDDPRTALAARSASRPLPQPADRSTPRLQQELRDGVSQRLKPPPTHPAARTPSPSPASGRRTSSSAASPHRHPPPRSPAAPASHSPGTRRCTAHRQSRGTPPPHPP